MKKAINLALSIISPLAAIPTGWAIYAGATETPVFPMKPWAAGVGAAAIIATSVAAGLLIVDILAYNQSMKNKTEREELSMSATPAWLVLGLCVVAEITLSLLIVVIPGALSYGVLVFPLMTAAGVFAFAIRFDLQERERARTELRESKRIARQTATRVRKGAKQSEQVQEPAAQFVAPVAVVQAVTSKYPHECGVNGCTYVIKNAQSVGGHMKAKHPASLGIFEPIKQEQTK